jgi:hypothetical protein
VRSSEPFLKVQATGCKGLEESLHRYIGWLYRVPLEPYHQEGMRTLVLSDLSNIAIPKVDYDAWQSITMLLAFLTWNLRRFRGK